MAREHETVNKERKPRNHDESHNLQRYHNDPRTKEEKKKALIDSYLNQNQRAYHGSTYIDPSMIPEGKAIMWARTQCKGRDLSRECAQLIQSHGWELVTPEVMPNYGYMGVYGDLDMESPYVQLPDMALLIRDKEINDAQLKQADFNNRQNRRLDDKIKRDDLTKPFAIANAEFFPADPESGIFSNTFISYN